jgi:hypothetical protein
LSVTCDRLVVFSGYSGFLHQYNWPPRYNWNIVENSVKHHEPKPKPFDQIKLIEIYKSYILYTLIKNWPAHMFYSDEVNSMYTTKYATMRDQYKHILGVQVWFQYKSHYSDSSPSKLCSVTTHYCASLTPNVTGQYCVLSTSNYHNIS